MSALPETIRKAAILITTLDQETADQLLEQMTPEQAQLVRNAAMDLGNFSSLETSEVIEEFLESNPKSAGVEIEQSLADKLVEASQLVDVDHSPPSEEEPPFLFLRETETDTLTEFLRWEHPQTIAVVLSHLPANQGMDVLVHFPDQLQSQILQRMISLEQTNPTVVHRIEQELERVFAEQIQSNQEAPAGLVAVQAILKQADAHHRQHLLKNLSSQDRQRLLEKNDCSTNSSDQQLVGKHRRKLADFLQDQQPTPLSSVSKKIKTPKQRAPEQAATSQQKTVEPSRSNATPKPHQAASNTTSTALTALLKSTPVHFDHLVQLNPKALGQVLQAVEPRILLLALVGASPELMNRITEPLSSADNRRLRGQMEQIGPLQLKDITTAQNLVVKTATRLAAEGRIQWPINSRFAATA